MMIKKYIEKIVENDKQEDMEELSEMLEETLYKLKEYDEECYEDYKMDLYIMAYGKVLTEDMAKKIVKEMRPYGEHWTMEQTSEVRRNYGISDINDIDFYVVMNKSYNDNKKTADNFVSEDRQLDFFVSLTKDFILDPDAKEGKIFDYFM